MKIFFRSGFSVDIDTDKAEKLAKVLRLDDSKFFLLNGELYNKVEVVAIVSDENADKYEHLTAGDWLCKKNMWHKKGRECDCKHTRYDIGEPRFSSTGVAPYSPPDGERLIGMKESIKKLAESKKVV